MESWPRNGWVATMFRQSPSIVMASIYGGTALLIFVMFNLIITPIAYFKHQKECDIKEQQSKKEKCKQRPIIKMPSTSLQVIKSITMSSNQSLSIKKLNSTKRKKLDSFKIVCFCNSTMSKGTPHQIYDDTHYNPSTNCYNCRICDRSFHLEKDKHLLFTCPNNILPIHRNGFVICSYCVWIVYTYQKNIKYYKHFVNNNIMTANNPQMHHLSAYNQVNQTDDAIPLILKNSKQIKERKFHNSKIMKQASMLTVQSNMSGQSRQNSANPFSDDFDLDDDEDNNMSSDDSESYSDSMDSYHRRIIGDKRPLSISSDIRNTPKPKKPKSTEYSFEREDALNFNEDPYYTVRYTLTVLCICFCFLFCCF